MPTRRSTVPLALSTVAGVAATTLMFVLPGQAAPTPSGFSAESRADVWRVNRLDLDMSGDPQTIGTEVAGVTGLTGQAAAPDRSRATAVNLDAPTRPSNQASVESVATATQDTTGTRTAAGQAGTVPNVLGYDPSVLSARGRWGGDTTCLTASTPLTQSKSISDGSGIVPAPIPAGDPGLPIPIPTEIPTEIPTIAPSDFPTELPTDLPTLPIPTLPTSTASTGSTDLPTLPTLPTSTSSTILPTLPTGSITTLLPTVTLPPITIAPADVAGSARAEGDVPMLEVAPASVEQRTLLDTFTGTTRRVYAEAVGTVTTPGAPIAEFFGGEATLTMTGAPKLAAYSTGTTQGSQVVWTPPQMVLTVGTTDYDVPTDGTALALPYSDNADVVLTVSAGKLTSGEAADGTLAQAAVSALNIVVKNGDALVLDAELFPMAVKALAPVGGVDCSAPPVVTPVKPQLKVTGKDNGPKPDRITLNALPQAAGAKATIFKTVQKKLRKLDGARLNAKGDRVFKVKDRNGKKRTKYVVKVGTTELTKAARGSTRIR